MDSDAPPNARLQDILHAIVRTYIETGEPGDVLGWDANQSHCGQNRRTVRAKKPPHRAVLQSGAHRCTRLHRHLPEVFRASRKAQTHGFRRRHVPSSWLQTLHDPVAQGASKAKSSAVFILYLVLSPAT